MTILCQWGGGDGGQEGQLFIFIVYIIGTV